MWKAVKEVWGDVRLDVYHSRVHGRGVVRSWARALYVLVGWLYGVTMCHFFDHRWEDQGHAGPDSGCVDMVCTRCGVSCGRVWLY